MAHQTMTLDPLTKPPATTNAIEAAALDQKVVPEDSHDLSVVPESALGLVSVDHDGPVGCSLLERLER